MIEASEGCTRDRERDRKKCRVLVLDDSELNLHFARSMLVLEGFSVQCAATARAFESAVASWRPDLVLIDVHMPGVEGTELCKRLKESTTTSHIKVVLFSSMPESKLAELSRKVGADGFLSKAGGYERFSQVFDELLGGVS